VTDFGIARSVDGARDLGLGELRSGRQTGGAVSALTETSQSLNAPLTQEGALLGTPRYMSPEQFRGSKTDPRTDQFSFCVALFEALHGISPFPGEQLASRCMNVINGRFQPLPPDVQRMVPMWLRTILLRGMSRDPEDRYPSMDALLAALSRDVGAIRRRWLITVAAGLLAVGLGAFSHRLHNRSPASLCRGNSERLSGVWDPARKQAVKTALLSTGRGYAQETWERLEQTLDGYTHDWLSGQVEACLATMVRGVQSQTALDLRVRCLNRRLDEVSALTEQLIRADSAALERAGGVAYELTPLAVCADVAALSAPVPLPDSPQQRQRVDELGRRLAELRAAERVGLYSSLLPKARAAVEEARKLGYAPLQAEAEILLGDLQIQSADRPGAEETLFQAVAAAVSGRDHRRAGEAWTMLMFLTAERRDYEPARRWELLARSELELTSSVDDLKGQLHNNLCIAGIRKRKYDDALKSCNEALEYRIKFFGPMHPSVAAVYANKALIYRHMDQLHQSLELSQRAYDIDARALGPHHPRIALTLANIGNIYRTQERFAEAEKVFLREADIYKTALGEDNPRYSEALYSLALTYQAQQRWSEAQVLAEQVLAIRRKALGPDHADVASALSLSARGYQRQRLFAQALPLHEEALAIHERRHAEEMTATLLVAVANDLRGLHRLDEALPLLDRAEQLHGKGPGSAHELLADIQFARARILLEQDPKRNRAQAVELSESARRRYLQQGLRGRHDLAELDAWRTENKLP